MRNVCFRRVWKWVKIVACIFVIWPWVLMYGRYQCVSTWTKFQELLATESPQIAELLDHSSLEFRRADLHKHYFLSKSRSDDGEVGGVRIPLFKDHFIEDVVRDREWHVHPQGFSDFLRGRVWLTHPSGVGPGGIQVSWGKIKYVVDK